MEDEISLSVCLASVVFGRVLVLLLLVLHHDTHFIQKRLHEAGKSSVNFPH